MNRILLVLSLMTFSLPSLAQEATKKTLAVLPFATLSGGVPSKAGQKAAGMLASELRNTEKVEVVEIPRPTPKDEFQAPLERARKSISEATSLRDNRKFRKAEEALQNALKEFKAGAGGLSDVAEFSDAYVLLSAVQYNTGRDEEGLQNLQLALAMAPSRAIPLAKTSPLFSRLIEDTRKKLLAQARGSVLLESTPSGAVVTFDGMRVGSTPLLLKEIPAGTHVWSTALSTGDITGGVVDVVATKQAKVSARTQSPSAETRLQIQLAQNKIDAEALDALKKLAEANSVNWLVFGALTSAGKNLSLDGWMFDAASSKVYRLPAAQFDAELLSAGMEFYNLAGNVLNTDWSAAPGSKTPTSVLNQGSLASSVTEAKFDVLGGQEDTAEVGDPGAAPVDDSGARKPLKRTPLKK